MDKLTIVYDKKKGTILSSYMGEEMGFLEMLGENADFLNVHGIKDVKHLDLLVADVNMETFSPFNYFIENGELTETKKIILSTDAADDKNPNGIPEIKGDGKSSCKITAKILDAQGNTAKHYADKIRFTTSRGKLSAKNGIVTAKSGVAEITLASAPETVSRVEVVAQANGCMDGRLELEFF